MAGASLELLWPLLELLPDAAFVADADGLIVATNEQAESLFGYASGVLLGRPVEALVPERLRREHRRHRAEFAAQPRRRAMGASLELRGRRADGSEFPVDVSLAPLEGPDGPLVLATVRDQTERQAANASHAQLAAIVRSSLDAMFSVSTDGKVTSWNLGAQRLLGYEDHEIQGRHYSTLLPDGASPAVEDLLGAAVAHEEAAPLDTVLVRRDGTAVDAALSVSPLIDLDRRERGFTLFARDITARKKAETEVQRALALAHRRQRELQAMADIRLVALDGTPIDAILQLITVTATDLLEPAAAAVYLRTGVGLERRFAEGHGGTAGKGWGGEHLAERVIDTGAAVHLDRDPAVVGAPIGRAGRTAGALVVARPPGTSAFDTDDRLLVTSLAGQASLAMEMDQARLSQQLLAVAGDRERIAGDLHDLVIQRIFANALSLEAIRNGPDRTVREVDALLSEIVEGLDETVREIRTTIFHLQHRRTEELRAAVLSVVEAASTSLGFAPQLRFEGPTDSAVPDSLAPHVTAVLREALSNVARHAHADEVTVAVLVAAGRLRVTVADNGRGLGPTTRRSGLANLARRAQQLGGTFDLDVPPGGGTRLAWQVPLGPPAE